MVNFYFNLTKSKLYSLIKIDRAHQIQPHIQCF